MQYGNIGVEKLIFFGNFDTVFFTNKTLLCESLNNSYQK